MVNKERNVTKNFRILTFSTALALLSAAGIVSAEVTNREELPLRGMIFTKDDPKSAEKALEALQKELGEMSGLLVTKTKEMEQQYKDLSTHYDGVKADNVELKKQVETHVAEYAEMVKMAKALETAVDGIKKELESPIFKGGKDLADNDRKAAIELQKRAHIFKGGTLDNFKEDTDKLVIAKDYRSAVAKLMEVGLKSKEEVIRSFTDAERKAFDSASLDSAFFSPELLGLELDCNIECAELVDLYRQVNVTKSSFMFPHVLDYGAIGSYDCDAKCDAELGPEGNITYKNGKTFDFRGVFCFQKDVLREANYPLLDFMFRAAARSYRINRNRALITGDGINEPLGWLTGDCFTKISTANLELNHVYWRRFLASAPVEYGNIVATMHQNVFAYLAAMTDTTGRFIFGDGQMNFAPGQVDGIRISNCLPDATAGGTRGSTESPFVAGDFVAAAGNWDMAYAAVSQRPMFMEQWMGATTAWCVKYQFGAKDGGFTMCCDAARTLQIGAAA
jgi:hypothetical protein